MGQIQPGGARPSERFRSAYDRTLPGIYRFVARSLGLYLAEIDDAVADVYLAVWRRIDDMPPQPEDRLWVFGIARKVIAQHRRTQVRRAKLTRLLAFQPIRSAYSVENKGNDLTSQLLESVSRLPRHEREAIELVVWEQMSYEDAAIALSCSVNAVRIRVHRGRKRILSSIRTASSIEDHHCLVTLGAE